MARRRTLWPAPKWTAAASSSAKQHVKRPRGAIGSAEQPAAKRARAPSSVQAVTVITCTENTQDFATNRDQRNLLQAVHNALESGAGWRVEHLLNVTLAQRSHQIARMASRSDRRAESPDTLVFSPDDMKEVMTTWRLQPATWMNPASLTKLKAETKQQDYHQACKQRFNTMLFELFGNKSLVETLIRIPIRSVAQPRPVVASAGTETVGCEC